MTYHIHTNRTWMRALKYFDNRDLDRSLYVFEMISRSPKIYFNMGMIHAGLGDYRAALDCFHTAVSDPSASSLEFFQLGFLLFSVEDYELAHKNFSIAFLLMAGRYHIDYKNSGLNFCLYSCEILFNCAMCLLHLGKFDEGKETLTDARDKQEYSDQIPCSLEVFSIPALGDDTGEDSRMTIRADYWTIFQVPNGTLYHPTDPQPPDMSITSKAQRSSYSPLENFPSPPPEYLASVSEKSSSSSNETLIVPARRSPRKLFKFAKQPFLK